MRKRPYEIGFMAGVCEAQLWMGARVFVKAAIWCFIVYLITRLA